MKHQLSKFFGILIISFTFSWNASAAFPTDWWPQFGQNAEWTVSNSNELSFVGNPGNSAMVATSFGNLGVPSFAGVRLTYDAYISANGAKNFIVILGSNAGFPGTGIMIVGNIYQMQALKNFDYNNAVKLSSNDSYFQNTAVIPGAYNSFIIDVSASGLITVTINGYQCPTTYQADINVLNAAGSFATFCPGFSPFLLKNLTVTKGASTKKYFHPVVPFTGSYYIDAVNGNDASSGHSEADAWKTFANVNNRVLAAGTKILLKSGSVWNSRLEIRGAGTVNNWITVGAYGTGNKPKISLTNNANDIGLLICDLDKTSGTAKMQNISYIEVKDIEISNTRLGIYYRVVTGTTNTGFRVSNVTFNNINCDPVMIAINSASNKDTEISNQLAAVKGNLQTINGAADGGVREYVFPAAIFIGGQTFGNQTVSGTHTTVLTELEVYNCQFNEAIAGVMSVFYWPFVSNGGANIWRQLVNKVKLNNCTATGVVNGAIAFDGVNGGAVADVNGVMQPDANGWGLFKNVRVTMGASAPGRTYPHGTTGVILSNCQKMLVDSCEFSEVLNQGNPDGCGFDFETNTDLVTIQNSKFINNDGHSVLIMNGGSFGGCSNIIFQKNLFAGNIKSGTSDTEFSLSRNSDGHTNIKFRNNMVFMRKKNINNANITFYKTDRTYFTPTYNDFYYLEPTAAAITVSFLGLPYTYKAQVNSVAAPQIAGLLLNNGAASTISRTIKVTNQYSLTKGTPAYYMISENASFTGASWVLYQSSFDYNLSAINGGKTVYFKVKNVSGESPTFSANIILNETTTILSAIDNENDIISVFPNPIKSIATLNFVNKNTEKENYTVEILSLTGVSLEKSIQNAASVQLDFSNYPAGTYILRLKGSKNVYSRKVVKQ